MNSEWGPDALIPFLVRLKVFGGPEFRTGDSNSFVAFANDDTITFKIFLGSWTVHVAKLHCQLLTL